MLLLTQKLPQKGKGFLFEDLVLSHSLNVCWSRRLIQTVALSDRQWILAFTCREINSFQKPIQFKNSKTLKEALL